ncbi:glutamate receptor 2.7-like [Rhodamnia argentea]|uniref:Glutamate receptor 2.7-like n=1 Tax=Rhodamnia argentea TaxID=178133 RepID=A0ABM3HC82_9MYRT|nr:glutamate receptor 2.7-like [Rhodamnia argentea]
MVGPTYKTDGFGFAFPLGSPLVSHFSRAILNVTQDKEKMDAIERKYFSSQSSCQDQDAAILSDNLSLSVDSFGGLFIITGVVSASSVFVYVASFFYSHWPRPSAIRPGNSSLRSKLSETAISFFQEHGLIGFSERNRTEVVPTSRCRSWEGSPNSDVELMARRPNEGQRPVLILHV